MATFDLQEFTLIEKFKKHDWYYEYLDSTPQWSEGNRKHRELIQEVRQIPMNKIPNLLQYVPENMRELFISELSLR